MAALESASTWLSACALALMALLTAAAIILRAFGMNLPDAMEFSSLFMAVAIFWGMVGAVRRGELIKIEFLDAALGPRAACGIRTVSRVITALFLCVLAWAGAHQLLLTLGSGEVTPELRLPLWPILALALSGLFITALAGLIAVRLHEPRETNRTPEAQHGR